MAKQLIISADDYGLSTEVNEAVERAHRDGVLQAASLMVAAPATQDAIRRARALPTLRIGLHVVLVNGRPLLPPERVAPLVDGNGNFLSGLAAAGIRFFLHPDARAALKAEIRAQFEAFARSGLALDHVNAQNHMHVHPTVLGIIIAVGREYGMRAVRVPYEPGDAAFLRPWLMLMRARLRRAQIATNDAVFGIRDSGHMTRRRVLELLDELTPGVSEMYFHPATGPWSGIDSQIAGYDFAGELDALTSPEVRTKIVAAGIETLAYSDLTA
ncbi:MAG TPA: hopanoid biosynthesis-associated protein HpnK [Candidatus Baltobacteraceae bacterium]|nr:hopanoid biosynthesis-associated protein HpnK [Candidatus Baltobacteraceae bacterium]